MLFTSAARSICLRLGSEEEVITLEYRFYCTHNAVRSAHFGGDTVPEGVHPVLNGGLSHERRHALSWCLPPACPRRRPISALNNVLVSASLHRLNQRHNHHIGDHHR
jgi:hypothetical protein